MCCVDCKYPPTPTFHLSDMWRELYIPSPEEHFLSTKCCCHLVLWHTGSHHIRIIIIINIISLLHLTVIKGSWPFFRLSLKLFLTRSLGFLVLLSNSPLSIFGCLSWGPASWLAITTTVWFEWTQAVGPPWASLVLSAFGCYSWGPASRWLSSEPSDLSGLDPDSPYWLFAKSPLRVFLGRFTYILYCAVIVYFCIPTWCNIFLLVLSNIPFDACFQLTFKLWNIIVQLLFNHCSVFWFWKCIPGILILLSTTITSQ